MTLTVNTDSYISLADSDTYLAKSYLSTDPKLIAWTALSDGDCEILLRKAAQLIDRQPLQGNKSVYTQVMAFPRINRIHDPSLPDYYTNTVVPDAVKHAQCEIAIEMCSGVSERVKLQRQGVKSFSIGSLSESYSGALNNVLSYEAKQLLAPYLAGSVRIV